MVEAGLDAINISMDAAGKEVFESTRVGLNYDKVVANIERLIRIARRSRQAPAEADSLVRPPEQLGRGAARSSTHWGAKADKIHITDLHNWAGTLNQESDVNFPCYRPWLTFTVLWDGRVSLCCADFDGREVLGDLRTQTIKDVWNSDAYRQVRRDAPRSRRPGHLPVVRSAEEGLAALDHEDSLGCQVHGCTSASGAGAQGAGARVPVPGCWCQGLAPGCYAIVPIPSPACGEGQGQGLSAG